MSLFQSEVIDEVKILDFDMETLAAGFADPNWVPQKITCVSWSWIDSDDIQVRICGPMGFFKPNIRRKMVAEISDLVRKADIVTGHNICRFDLPVLNAECLRLGLDPLPPLLTQDTMRIKKTKGLKKGQDNLGKLLKTIEQKLSLDWQGWEDAYAEDGWPTVKARCISDVIMHKQVREEMIARGWLNGNKLWEP